MIATNPKLPSIAYSDRTVALVQALDRCEVALAAAQQWFPEELEAGFQDEQFPIDVTVAQHSLGILRDLAYETVAGESPFRVERDQTGAPKAPQEIIRLFRPLHHGGLCVRLRDRSDLGSGNVTVESLSSEALRIARGHRVIVDATEGALKLLPDDWDDAFIEVWYRRSYGTDLPGSLWPGAYPCYLVARDYGWQDFSLER